MSSILHRYVARLCLALVLLCGLVPAQGLVLCIETDGCLSFEFKAPDAGCGGCEGHVEQAEQALSDLPADIEVDCPCIDLEVRPNEPNTRVHARTAEWSFDGLIAPAPEGFGRGHSVCARAWGAALRPTPRVADGLAHLCSVILQV